MAETINVCWYLRWGFESEAAAKPGVLRWCEMDFVHPQYSGKQILAQNCLSVGELTRM